MKLVVEAFSRYLVLETGAVDYEAETVEETEDVAEIVRLPLGFQAPPVAAIEGADDGEEPEAAEADCG